MELLVKIKYNNYNKGFRRLISMIINVNYCKIKKVQLKICTINKAQMQISVIIK